MSDNWIKLVPVDPKLVPDSARQKQAADYIRRTLNTSEIEIESSHKVEFFDCGSNFESVHCPHCHSSIEMNWWGDRIGDDFNKGFQLLPYSLPCCGKRASLNELVYEWPQAFGRFVLSVMNPGIPKLQDEDRRQLEEILGTQIRVVYQHL